MADGTNVVEPTSSTTTQITTIDTHEVDFGAGDIRDRQRVILAGLAPGESVPAKNADPAENDYGLLVRDTGTGTDATSVDGVAVAAQTGGRGVRGWLSGIFGRLGNGSQVTGISTPKGKAWVTTAGVATPLLPTVPGYMRPRRTG